MVVTTINSATGRYRHLEGTAQEVIDAMATTRGSLIQFGSKGTTYFALFILLPVPT